MAVSSPVDIANVALKRVGAASIVALTEATDRASLMNQLYPLSRDELLSGHDWNFASIRVTLNLDTALPNFGYLHQFILPTSPLCLRVRQISPVGTDYTIETGPGGVGRRLLTDEPAVSIRYTGQILDVSQYDPSFVAALALDLAFKAAYPLTKLVGLQKLIGEEAQNALQHARSFDSKEGSTKQASISTLVDVRRHSFEDFSRNRNSI